MTDAELEALHRLIEAASRMAEGPALDAAEDDTGGLSSADLSGRLADHHPNQSDH